MVKTTKSPCEKCKHKKCQAEGKPCLEVEKLLRKEKIRSSNWIRPYLPPGDRAKWGKWREIPFSSLAYDEETGEYYEPKTRKRKQTREES